MSEELGSGWGPAEEPGELLTSARDERESLLRRHPWWVAGAVVVGAVVVGMGWYISNRPPAESRTLDVQIAGLGGQGQYTVVLRTTGEQVHPVGVVGPGLTDPSSTIARVTSTGPGIGNLGATIDCSGQWWDARPGDYLVRVERTDAYGRTRSFDVPPDGVEYWWERVQNECQARALFDLPPVTATTGAADRAGEVDVTLHVENPNAFELQLAVRDFDEGFVSSTGTGHVTLVAGATSEVALTMHVHCRHGRPQLSSHTFSTGDGEYNGPGLAVGGVTAQDGPDTVSGPPSLLRIDPTSAQVIDDALAAACP